MKDKNILFLTLVKIDTLEQRGIYQDLMRKFSKEGFNVYIVSPVERREGKKTFLKHEDRVTYLYVKTFNLQKTNVIEKGIGTIAIEYQFSRAINKYFHSIKFDIILYSTPPITFSKIIQFVKKRDGSLAYLLLKDIFPQNAVDLRMIKKHSVIHRYFKRKEIKLYEVSDYIGCMSPANVEYLIDNNPQLNPNKIEVNPNSLEPFKFSDISEVERASIRTKFKIPEDKIVFIYGGNLGKPQGLDFLLECIKMNRSEKAYFLIVGSGTEYNKTKSWFDINKPSNAKLIESLPKKEYDQLLQTCDVGLIFLHPDFSIPNFPSRLLSYMEYKIPVIAATDNNTDIGKIAQENNFGFGILSGDLDSMNRYVNFFISNKEQLIAMGVNGHKYMLENYDVSISYKKIVRHL